LKRLMQFIAVDDQVIIVGSKKNQGNWNELNQGVDDEPSVSTDGWTI